MVLYRWRVCVPLVMLSICLLSQFSDAKESKELYCFTNKKYTPKSFYDGRQIIIAYLKRVQMNKWQLCAGNGGGALVDECAKIDYDGNDAGTSDIRLFFTKAKHVYLAWKKSGKTWFASFDASGTKGFDMNDKHSVDNVENLFDITLNEKGLYNSKSCKMVHPADLNGKPAENCCKLNNNNEYYLFDIVRNKCEKIEKTNDDQMSIFVVSCNYYYAGVKERNRNGKTYVSHMPTFMDYNQLHCFVGTDDTTQFIMMESDLSYASNGCRDIDIAKLNMEIKHEEDATLPPDRLSISELEEGDIYECMSSWDFLTTAAVDASLIGVILIVIVLAQLGVAEKNRGRVRSKWYKRRPRMRRRHRRHGGKDMTTTEASQMTNASVLTGTSAMTGASQYTTGASDYK